MAINGGDGSIILTTQVDQKGLNTGLKSMRGAVNSTGTAFKKLGSYIATALSVSAFINFSKEAGNMATQQEANVQRLIDIYGDASKTVGDFIDTNARGLGLSKSMASSVSATYGNLLSVWADQETNANLTNSLLNQTSVVASKTGRTVEDVSERIRSGLLGNTEAIEDLGINVNIKTIEITDAFKRIADGRSWQQLSAYEQAQVRTLAILEQSTNKYGNTVAETSAFTKQQYQAAYEDMQATWGVFINTILMPVLKVATQIMNIITAGMRQIAGLTGKTIENNQNISSSIGGAVDNQNDLTDAVKKTNKEMKRSLAGFDEIQKLTKNDTSDTSVSGAEASDVSNIGTSSSGTKSGGQEEGINTMLATIMSYVGFGMVAIGLILLFNGHIGWGIGFIIAGAATIYVSQAALKNAKFDFSAQLSSIIAGVGLLIAAIGLILLLKTMSPLAHSIGLGMIIAGVGIFAVGAVQTIANNIGGDIGNMLHGIIAIVSGFALAIGLILLFSGQITPLSIGLVVAGAVGLVSEIALYGNKVKKSLQGWVGGILAIVSGFVLVIGLIMLFTGHITPLSIGLVVAGAIGLASTLALNWDKVKNEVSKFIQNNTGLIVGVSLALLVLGIILCLVGVINPLSIGLIVAGAVGLVSTVTLNWEKMKNSISDFIKNNSALIVGVSLALLVLGIILCLTGVGIPLGIALISVGAAGLVTVVALNWNAIKEKITGIINNILTWVKTYGLLVLGIILCLTGVGISSGIALIIKWAKDGAEKGVPLATTIVDKVKEIWGKIKTFWNTYIAKIFKKEWWLNLAKKCGNGLITGFESGVNAIISLFEKMINFVVNGLNVFLKGVDTVISAVGNVLGQDWGVATIPSVSLSRVSIPRLAQGAVIPGGREFMAVLGDQPKGQTNIEAPADLIKQMVKEALIENGGATPQVNIVAKGDLDSIISLFKFEIERQDRLAGATI